MASNGQNWSPPQRPGSAGEHLSGPDRLCSEWSALAGLEVLGRHKIEVARIGSHRQEVKAVASRGQERNGRKGQECKRGDGPGAEWQELRANDRTGREWTAAHWQVR